MNRRNWIALGLIVLAQIGLVICYWGIISGNREHVEKRVNLQNPRLQTDWLRPGPAPTARQESKESAVPTGIIPVHFEEKKDSEPKTLPPQLVRSRSLEKLKSSSAPGTNTSPSPPPKPKRVTEDDGIHVPPPLVTLPIPSNGLDVPTDLLVQAPTASESKKMPDSPKPPSPVIPKPAQVIPPPPVEPENPERKPIPPINLIDDKKPNPPLAIPIEKTPAPILRFLAIPDVDYDLTVHHCHKGSSLAKICTEFYASEKYTAALRQYARDNDSGGNHFKGDGEPKYGDRVLVPPAKILEERYPNLLKQVAKETENPGPCPWKLNLRIVNRRTYLTARTKYGLEFIVICDRLELQRPHGRIQAAGDVELEGGEFSGRCRKLTIAWHEDFVHLQGNARVRSGRNGEVMEMNAEHFRFRLRSGAMD